MEGLPASGKEEDREEQGILSQHHDSGGPYGEEAAGTVEGAPPKWIQLWAEEQRKVAEENRQMMELMADTLANHFTEATMVRNSRQKPEGPRLEITKMTSEDDPEAYLRTFERVAQAEGWPKEQWAAILGMHLTGVVQQVVDNLPPWEVADYEQVKRTILGMPNISGETWRQRLKETRLEIGDRVCFKGSERGQVRQAREKRDPLKASAWSQAKEEWACLQQQLDEKHKQEMELLRSSLFYQYQENLMKVKKDLSDRYTSEIEELKRKHRVSLEQLLMMENEYQAKLDVLEAQKQSVSTQQEEIEKLKNENARLREVGVREERRFKKELEQIRCKLIVEHADKLRRTRKEVQEVEQIRKAENEEWKLKWDDLKRESEEKLSLVYKDLENKAEIEKQVFQKQYELREAEMIGLQEQQAVRIVELEKSLKGQQNHVQELEAQVKKLGEQSQKDLAATESSLRAAMKDKEQEVEQLSNQVKTLQAKLEETNQQQKGKLMASEEKAKGRASEKEQVQAELATEKREATTAREFVEEQELELKDGRVKDVSRNKVPRSLQGTVDKRQGTSETLKKELGVLTRLGKELQSGQEKDFRKEQIIWTQQHEMAGAETLIGEWMPIERLDQLWQMEQASLENQYKKRSMHPEESFVSRLETGPTSRGCEAVAPVLPGGVCDEEAKEREDGRLRLLIYLALLLTET